MRINRPFLRYVKIDNIIQIERLRYVKIRGEKRFFHDSINNRPVKSEYLKPHGSLCVHLLLCFLFRSSPLKKIILESSCSIICKTPLETPQWISALVAGHRPSYLQKLNCAACCPLNFLGISSLNCSNQKQPPEVCYKKGGWGGGGD